MFAPWRSHEPVRLILEIQGTFYVPYIETFLRLEDGDGCHSSGVDSVSRHALRDLLHISRDTLLAVLRTMCVRHVNLSSD